MKDISNSVDDKLKIYASSQKVNIPDSADDSDTDPPSDRDS